MKGTCTKLHCDCWHPPECQFYKSELDRKVDEQQHKKPKKGGDKNAVAIVKDIRQLGCVLHDLELPESEMLCKVQRDSHRETWSMDKNCETSAVSRKSTEVLGPNRRVRFTRAALRPGKNRENKRPSLGIIQVKAFQQRSPYAVKFEDRSQEETERQELCARGDARRLAKNINKLKEKEKAALFSPSDVWIMPAASTRKLEDREFVVDSGASMHMVSKKDFHSAELETVKVSKNQTTLMTANGEVESTVHVRELDFFVTVMLLENAPAVLSLGKVCEVHGCHWTCGPVVRNHFSFEMAER